MSELEICLGPECGACGGPELLKALRAMPVADTIGIHGGHCHGLCHEAPVAALDDILIAEATMDTILQRLDTLTT